ncbi:O-antigen translocase [Salinimicrobium terrae]|uniref:O-antigen translocase n=1 Tax=Salinimicrobium terrae TaxID=470866 RepID=UPI00041CAB4B|nr:O-antigen translocase [Salinimicrobium terrae]
MAEENKSFSRIFKSSSIVGGAEAINMLIGIIRVKFVAVLIGPVGVGLVGTYRSAVAFIGTIAGMGLQSSAVRDVAKAVSGGHQEHVGRTVLTLQRMCWLTGGLGSLGVLLFSHQISQLAFSSPKYSVEVAWVGLTILFANVKGGQMALIQGMRRIADLAKLNVIGIASGSIISVCLYWWLGQKGIVPAIVIMGFIELLASWWFARKVEVPKVKMSWRESFLEAGGMIKLGLAFMWSGALTMGVAFAAKALISYEIDLVAVGIFSAAFSLSGMVVNFVLRAMGADYFPSLTAVKDDHTKMRDLVNQQTEIGLLLSVPGILGTVAFAPLVIYIFYTPEFSQAIDLLRWFALGCLGRVISWPLGFVILAKGAGKLFAFTETFANSLHLAMIWFGLLFFGINGTGMAFFFLYLFYSLLMLVVTYKLIGFSWSRGVRKLLFVLLPIVALTFLSGILLPQIPGILVGLVLTIVTSVCCLRGLYQRLGADNKLWRVAFKVPGMKYILT